MALGSRLWSLAVVTTLVAGSVGTSGCVIRARGHARIGGPVVYVEQDDPPPPRVVVVDTRPGHVWVEGRWVRTGRRWHWRDGHWQRQRANAQWVQGRWDRGPTGWIWVEGRWDVAVNNGPGPGTPGTGVIVRDHR